MAFYPTDGPAITCKHPHPHQSVYGDDCVYDDGYKRVHCSDVTCDSDKCHKDRYIKHPHQHCNFDDYWDRFYCAYHPYKTYHGHMHIDPCHHDHVIQTTPIYDYDYDRNVYIPNYRGDNGLVLNLDYSIRSIISIDILYENGERLSGEIVEGLKYSFIYADSGILKRDVGLLKKIEITNGEVSNSRLGFAEPSSIASIYLHFDCSSESKAHNITVDINLLRSINVVKEEIDPMIVLPNGEKTKDIDKAIGLLNDGDTINGNGTFIVKDKTLDIIKNINLVGFIFENTKVNYTNTTKEITIMNNVFKDGSSIRVTGSGDVNFIRNTLCATESYDKASSTGVRVPVILDISGKTIVQDNMFNNTGAYYNSLEFGQTNALGTESIIENNYFRNSSNNAINIFNVQDNAKMFIRNNLFDTVSNPIRLSNYTKSKAIFRFVNNRYNSTSSKEEYAGFILLQKVKECDFSLFNIYIEGLYYKEEHITEQSEGETRVWYIYNTDTEPNVIFLD